MTQTISQILLNRYRAGTFLLIWPQAIREKFWAVVQSLNPVEVNPTDLNKMIMGQVLILPWPVTLELGTVVEGICPSARAHQGTGLWLLTAWGS